jgi:HK97 family phage major capsid protein
MSALTEARERVRDLSSKCLDVTESTKMTPAEQRGALDTIEPDLKKWIAEVRDLEFVAEKRRELFGNDDGHDAAADSTQETSTKSWGEQFREASGYKNLISRGLSGGSWTSGDVELKTTLTTGAGGASLVATPTVTPGILPVLSPTLTIADLFPSSATDSPLIRYLVETAYTNAATTVAEGALKPESAVAFDKVDETLHKIATFLPITDEMLEDGPQLAGFIDNRLKLFVQQAEESELLSGTGLTTHLTGILARSGLSAPIVKGAGVSVAGDNSMDVLYRQITAIRTSSFLDPDAIVIDPISWQNILIAKNSQGAYYANGPFAGAQPPTLWGLKVVVTPAMAANTALVGCFSQGGMIFRKGGLTVEASNSHNDFFQKNLTALRAEERLGLAVFRPGAFGKVTGL